MVLKRNIKCVLHGSFRRHFDSIKEVHTVFTRAGIDVIAPDISAVVGVMHGFAHLKHDRSRDHRITELLYLKKVAALGQTGFSYYINPEGTLGTSASYELAVDQLTNTRYLFMKPLRDLPAYVPQNSVWEPGNLAAYIQLHQQCPPPIIARDERRIYRLMQELILPGSIIAVGAIIVDYSSKRYRSGQERDILMVRTHKWSGRFSIVGGKVQRKERLADALQREIGEETGLEANIEESICTFDELKHGGYFIPDVHRVFTDNVVRAGSRKVVLNDEAEEYVWMPPSRVVRYLNLEPNALITVKQYQQGHARVA